MGRSEREEITLLRLARDLALAQAKDIARQFNEAADRIEALTQRVLCLEQIKKCPNCNGDL